MAGSQEESREAGDGRGEKCEWGRTLKSRVFEQIRVFLGTEASGRISRKQPNQKPSAICGSHAQSNDLPCCSCASMTISGVLEIVMPSVYTLVQGQIQL